MWTLPIPKVYVPAIVGFIAIAVHWVATGEFNRTELAGAVAVALYALIGYSVPDPNVVTSTGYRKQQQ